MKNRTHFHHKVVSFNGEIGENGLIKDAVQVTVIGFTTEQKAIARAKQVVVRENYKLEAAWECNSPDTEELQKEYLAFLRSANKHLGNEDDV